MIIVAKKNARRYKRDMIESYLLVSKKTSDSENLTVTVVEMQSNGFQRIHAHEPEQMYYILKGTGIIYVDGEEKKVGVGDCVFFKSFSKHGLRNIGDTVLSYLSAASPSFPIDICDKAWPLPPRKGA